MQTVQQSFVFAKEYDSVIKKLRNFFDSKGFKEVHVQNRLSILAACEDPSTIVTYKLNNVKYPHPQTGQMWLEHDLLKNPELNGIFCVTTSFRNEQNPIKGRHDIIFPMFEFEMKGDINELIKIEKELLEYLGYGKTQDFLEIDYETASKKYGVTELQAEHENKMLTDYGKVVLLKKFPEHTSPFWNMKKSGNHALKVDVILDGVETIGSAERSTNPKEMKEWFQTISNGEYAKKLYDEFGEKRVNQEIDEFLTHKFFERCGGGIGITRLIKSMGKNGLI